MKTLLIAAGLVLTAALGAHADEMPKAVHGVWCATQDAFDYSAMDNNTYKRGPCAKHKARQLTISASGFRIDGSECKVSTVDGVKIGWKIDFGCLYSAFPSDHGYKSLFFYPMTGNRLGVVSP